MLPENSFLRQLPAVTQTQQKWKLEALVYAADVASYSFDRILELTKEHSSTAAVAQIDKIALFTHVWSIVDQIHVVRQLIEDLFDLADKESEFSRTESEFSQSIKDFYQKYEVATLLRNKMDHLRENIPNLSKKSSTSPLFGAVSYFLLTPEDIKEVEGKNVLQSGKIVALIAGSIADKNKAFFVDPLGKKLKFPVGLFQLYAFNDIFYLEQAVEDLNLLMRDVEISLKEEIEKQARESGYSIEELMKPDAESLTSVATIKFNNEVEKTV